MPSTIEWTDEVWNPTVGCSVASPGCDHCYAATVAHRGLTEAHHGLTIKRKGEPAEFNGTVRCLPDRLDTPLRWRKPRRVFVDSMSDLFHPEVLKAESAAVAPGTHRAPFLAHVFARMVEADRHTFQVLTKRPPIMAAVLNEPRFRLDVNALLMERGHAVMPGGFESPWPSNIWCGTSIESDRYTFRADHLRATPAGVRFLSLEPLLGPLPSLDLTGIDWVIVGGESGPGARPMHPDWVRDIRDRCVAAGVPFFFKQWGEWCPLKASATRGPFTHRLGVDGSLRLKADRVPAPELDLVEVARFGKKAAGRSLDSRTWDEFPAVAS